MGKLEKTFGFVFNGFQRKLAIDGRKAEKQVCKVARENGFHFHNGRALISLDIVYI